MSDIVQRRTCYVNFASHLLNRYNPNVLYQDLPWQWSLDDWRSFVDMIAGFGFNCLELWLVPRLFSPNGWDTPVGRAFVALAEVLREQGERRGVQLQITTALTTVGQDWHTHCPRVPEEWDECRRIWTGWLERLPADVVHVFPGDPGGCSRNGCTHADYIDGALEVAGIVSRVRPQAQVVVGTWGTPFWGWGVIEAPPGWQGEFLAEVQHTAWRFDAARADAAMACLLDRLPRFPDGTGVTINLGFNGNGDPGGEDDARNWVRELAQVCPIYTWDFSLTEGENHIAPHYRFDRLFRRRREERDTAAYRGGICFTMTPLLNQLSLYESAVSFRDPDADPAQVASTFLTSLFGSPGAELVPDLYLFETLRDWGSEVDVDLERDEYHRRMRGLADRLRSLEPVAGGLRIHPSPEFMRDQWLFFADLYADLSGPAPDYVGLASRYWQRVYSAYDRLPEHVDPRPRAATRRLIRHFAAMGTDLPADTDPLPGLWVS
jgi:hypothetical protein